MAGAKLQALWNHPAGPKTIHFWAPTFKWGISLANVADFSKPPEKISYPQQIAVACTGVIWSRYSTIIIPKNWNLFSVNVAMAGTGLYQLSRKIRVTARAIVRYQREQNRVITECRRVVVSRELRREMIENKEGCGEERKGQSREKRPKKLVEREIAKRSC
ncbi:hypothetical protein AMTR_s00074p00155110 [Amborella trichopoda]|uniref:Mitochondrial pyruvate carrier n=1 Tax=Amborella trichopoda TaxID=13333 RepID=W1NMY5_AMBTC|nr:hypothetical protein AMTR_s00074p00155110 [Amborella trichopoda]